MVGRGIAVLFHDCGTRRGWVVSSTPRPHFTPGKEPVPIIQEAGWAPGPVWTGGKSRPHRDSIPDRPARSQSLYRLSYRAHKHCKYKYFLLINTGLFKMTVGLQLSSGNSAPNSGNNHHLTIPFGGGMHSFKRQGKSVSGNWRSESEPPLKPSPLTCGTK